jgi:tungstate transport system permease protein
MVFMWGEVLEITSRSVMISLSATLLAASWSILASYALTRSKTASKYVMPVLQSLVGIPTVLIGLLLYTILSRSGPLGFLSLLYTPNAIILGESILITPLLITYIYGSLKASLDTYGELAYVLGGDKLGIASLVIRESTPQLFSSIIIAFSRAMGELGIALMVGGNIKGLTRVMTTAIALEVSKGEFELAIALGAILVLITISVAVIVNLIKKWWER